MDASSHLVSLLRGCHPILTCARALVSVTRWCLVCAWRRQGKGVSIKRSLPAQRRTAHMDNTPLANWMSVNRSWDEARNVELWRRLFDQFFRMPDRDRRLSAMLYDLKQRAQVIEGVSAHVNRSSPPREEALFTNRGRPGITNRGRHGISSNVAERRAFGMQMWMVVGEFSNGGHGVADHCWKIRRERPDFMDGRVATVALYYLRGKDLQDTNYNEYLAWFRFMKRMERSRKEGAKNDPVPCHCIRLHQLFLGISPRLHKLFFLVFTVTTFHKSAGMSFPWAGVLLPLGGHRLEPLVGVPSVACILVSRVTIVTNTMCNVVEWSPVWMVCKGSQACLSPISVS